MYTAVAVLVGLLYLSTVLHELAHLISFRNKNVLVREFGIGMRAGPRICYIPRTGKFKDIKLSFYIFTFFLGAFVDVSEKMFELSYKERALAFCAGPFANIHLGCIIYISLFMTHGGFEILKNCVVYSIHDGDIMFFWHFFSQSPYLWIPTLTIPVLWFGRNVVATYFGPILGIILLTLNFLSVTMNMSVPEYFGDVIGPIGFIEDLPKMAPDMWTAVEWGAQLSLALGALNLLPIPPLDSGYLVLSSIKKRFPRIGLWYEKIGFLCFSGMLIFIFSKDIINYFGNTGLVFSALILVLIYLVNKKKK